MQIDWFTIIAQIVNFLILVGLLKHFLYGPIIKAMDDREERITARLKEAQHREEKAEEQAQSYRDKRRQLDENRDEFLDQARHDADKTRQSLIQSARDEVDEMRARWQDSLRQERDSFLLDLRATAARQICAATRRILQDLANHDLEARIVYVFIARLHSLDDDSINRMQEGLADTGGSLSVTSSFQLSDDLKSQLSDALKNSLSQDTLHPAFSTYDDLICGLEVSAGGRKIAWNVDDYLDALGASLSQTLDEETSQQ